MLKDIGNKLKKKVETEIDNLDAQAIKNGAKTATSEIVGAGVDTAKAGIFGIINGIIFKIVAAVVLVVVIISAGCVGTSVAVDSITSKEVSQ